MISVLLVIAALLVTALVGIALSLLHIPVEVHRDMTRQFSKSVARGSYADFVREMRNHNWKTKPSWPTSFFDYSTDSEVHASIVRFDGVGMLLGAWDWWRVKRWLKKNTMSAKSEAKSWAERDSALAEFLAARRATNSDAQVELLGLILEALKRIEAQLQELKLEVHGG